MSTAFHFCFSNYRSARSHGDPWGKNPCGVEMEPRVGSERTRPAHEKGKCTKFHCAPLREALLERKLLLPALKTKCTTKEHRKVFWLQWRLQESATLSDINTLKHKLNYEAISQRISFRHILRRLPFGHRQNVLMYDQNSMVARVILFLYKGLTHKVCK